MTAHDRITVQVDRLSLGGEGVCRLPTGQAGAAGLVIFVPYSAPGDELEIELTESHKRFARGRILKVLKPSPDRITPKCPYHFDIRNPDTKSRKGFYCGGCSWQHLRYEAQLKGKQALVQETLERIGGIRGVMVKPVLGMKDPWRYRNKVQMPVGWDARARRLIAGFYAPSSHEIVPIDDCLVQPELSVAILNRARALLAQYHVRAYDDQHHQGWIRHLWVRTTSPHPNPLPSGEGWGEATSQALLVFVTRSPDFPHEREILTALAAEFPQLAGVHQNVNPGRTNVILGRQWRKLAGADFIEERLGALRFRLSPGSFFQVNTVQAEALYTVVKEMAGRGERLLDLYSGVGGIALWLSQNFQEIGGVDDVRSAIEDAEANAELNAIDNARFLAQPVEQFLKGVRPHVNKGSDPKLTVTVDPPRSGCSPEVIKGILTLRPRTLVYVSCDPGTLARDLALLIKGGFHVQEVQPVDLFPHTPHIETAVKLMLRS